METGQVRAEQNWNFCALCEQETEEKLVCPLNSTRKNYGSGYKSLAHNLQQFREIGELPIQASLSSLDEGNGIEETLKHREAKWHKSCFNKCSTLKLQMAQKGKLEDSSVEGSEAPSPVSFVRKLGKVFAEQQLLHLTARSEEPLLNCKTESF